MTRCAHHQFAVTIRFHGSGTVEMQADGPGFTAGTDDEVVFQLAGLAAVKHGVDSGIDLAVENPAVCANTSPPRRWILSDEVIADLRQGFDSFNARTARRFRE